MHLLGVPHPMGNQLSIVGNVAHRSPIPAKVGLDLNGAIVFHVFAFVRRV